MAKIKWTKKAGRIFFGRVEEAYVKFGLTTAKKWQQERIKIEHHLELYPESYTPEALLADRKRRYRSCHIMKRFKFVYYYAKTSDTVNVVDIWDTRQAPETLRKRIQ